MFKPLCKSKYCVGYIQPVIFLSVICHENVLFNINNNLKLFFYFYFFKNQLNIIQETLSVSR